MEPQTETFLSKTLSLARDNARTLTGGPFAALIVHQGEVVATGTNQVVGNHDPTAHAEVMAIRAAGQALGDWNLSGCELYSSCEPCPMCLAAAYWAHVDRIVYAADRDDAAGAGFDDRFLYQEMTLPVNDRRIPMVRALRNEGRQVLEFWTTLENRVQY